jgi:hypothetical protein
MPFIAHDGTYHANLHAACPGIHFYEYTKHPLARFVGAGLPANLHVTYSVNESAESDARAAEYLAAGFNAAVVTFTERHKPPRTFELGGHTWPTIDGDAHDARFLDPRGHIVILAAKGDARYDTSGFVRSPN